MASDLKKMNNNLDALEPWAKSILRSLDATSRKRLMKQIGFQLRKQNAMRMTAQTDPEGKAWPARKRQKPQEANKKRRRKKPRKMMTGLRKAQFLRVKAWSDGTIVGYSSQNARTNDIARIHHYGLRQRIGKRNIPYPKRRLLGISPGDREMIGEMIINAIKKT